MNHQGRTILVTGATGRQGGAVARHLLAAGWTVRALSRDPSKPAARALADAGAEVVPGDLDDRASLDRALSGVYGVFSVQNAWEHGPAGEVRQGKALAEAARAAGVAHFVQSSVGGAERRTGIPHFDSKWAVEQHVRALDLPATVLRPVFFMENFLPLRPAVLEGAFSLALRPDRPLQMIAVEDIGAFAALAFARPERFLGQALELAGDELTMPQVAETFARVIGRPVRFVEQPLEALRRASPERALMFQWFNDAGYRVDLAALRALHPDLLTFERWLRATGWDRAAG